MIYLIIGCEIAFWVLVASGLVARYVFKARRLGLVLLMATPVVDLILLGAAALDLALHSGGAGGGGAVPPGTPGGRWAHAVAALYVGVSLAFGHKMIRWADAVAAKRAGLGPGPRKLYGRAYTAECWRDFARALLAVAIAAVLLKGLDLIAGTPVTRTGELFAAMAPAMRFWLLIELIWAGSYTLWPRKPAAEAVGA
jgi:hypothetical protein